MATIKTQRIVPVRWEALGRGMTVTVTGLPARCDVEQVTHTRFEAPSGTETNLVSVRLFTGTPDTPGGQTTVVGNSWDVCQRHVSRTLVQGPELEPGLVKVWGHGDVGTIERVADGMVTMLMTSVQQSEGSLFRFPVVDRVSEWWQ